MPVDPLDTFSPRRMPAPPQQAAQSPRRADGVNRKAARGL